MAVTRSTNERGYDARHQSERARWQRQLDAGAAARCACARPECKHHDQQCPTIITATSTWDLGHTDDRSGWTGPECVPCNRSAGGRNGNRVAREKRETRVYGW